MGIFKKMKYSITNIEKYSEMSAEGVKSAFKYLLVIILILSLVTAISLTIRSYKAIQDIASYIESNIPNFNYKDKVLTVEGEQPKKIDVDNEEFAFSKIIIDTNELNDEKINEYVEELKGSGYGILILRDKARIVYGAQNTEGDSNSYTEMEVFYNDYVSQLPVNEFTKADVLNYMKGTKIIGILLEILLMFLIEAIIEYFIITVCVALLIGAMGYLTAILLRAKMRFVAVFNMAIYALTLSTLLQAIYNPIDILTDFRVSFFYIMYVGVAFIYLIAAIFLTRIDLIKNQEELTKIKEVQKEVKKEMEDKEKEKEKEQKEENNKESKKEEEQANKEKKKKTKKKKENEAGGEPEGSNV